VQKELSSYVSTPHLLSCFKAITTSDPEADGDPESMVDGNDSSCWKTSEETAWIEIDLGALCNVNSVGIKWKKKRQMGKSYKIMSSMDDDGEFQEEINQEDVNQSPIDETDKHWEGWSRLPGWSNPTKKVKIELSESVRNDRHEGGTLYGIIEIHVVGAYATSVPTTPAGVLKMAASMRLATESVATTTTGRASDADERVASNKSILDLAIGFIHAEIDKSLSHMEGRARIPIEELSFKKPVYTTANRELAANLVDGTDEEWWVQMHGGVTDTACIQVNLQQRCTISGLTLVWSGESVAESYKVFSSVDGMEWAEQVTQDDATSKQKGTDRCIMLPGWSQATNIVRVELADESSGPKRFGLRKFSVMGRKGNTTFESAITENENDAECERIAGEFADDSADESADEH